MSKSTKSGFVVIPGWVYDDYPQLSATEAITLSVIYSYSQDGQSEYLGGYPYLKKVTFGVSEETLRKTINKLKNMGLIKERRRKGKTSAYRAVVSAQDNWGYPPRNLGSNGNDPPRNLGSNGNDPPRNLGSNGNDPPRNLGTPPKKIGTVIIYIIHIYLLLIILLPSGISFTQTR